MRVWRAAYKDGGMPAILEAGFLIERFNRLPHELGLTKTPDLGFLYRALEALHVYRTAQKYQGDISTWKSMSEDEWRTVSKVRKALVADEKARGLS